MTTLHQMTIKSTISDIYHATITLAESNRCFALLTLTTHRGDERESIDIFEDYPTAIKEYINKVSEYAEHTAFMTL